MYLSIRIYTHTHTNLYTKIEMMREKIEQIKKSAYLKCVVSN